jgi:hypothetical protein
MSAFAQPAGKHSRRGWETTSAQERVHFGEHEVRGQSHGGPAARLRSGAGFRLTGSSRTPEAGIGDDQPRRRANILTREMLCAP